MLKDQNYSVSRFPYVWPSNVMENVIETFEGNGFKHLHFKGAAGSGKSRCITEIRRLKGLQSDTFTLYYSSSEARNSEETMIDVLNSQIGYPSNLTIKNIDIYKQINHISNNHPIILFIEDLHYENDIRDQFISKIINHFSEKNNDITLITSSRLDFQLGKMHNFNLIEIENLTEAEAKSLIQSGIQQSRTIETISEKILEESNGNPLFISEAMNIVLEGSENTNLNVAPLLCSNIHGIEGLYDIILSSLNEMEQKTLKAASIIGKRFSFVEMSYLLAEYRDYLPNILTSLCNKYIIGSQDNGQTYSFKHDLQYERIYKHNEGREKWAWHVALAEKYKNERKYSLCGNHYYWAELYKESIKYLTYSARKLLRSAQPQKADLFFEKAFDAFEKSELKSNQSFFNLQVDYCYSLLMQGRVKDGRKIFHALQLNPSANSEKAQLSVQSLEIKLNWTSGHYDKAYVLNLLNTLPQTPSYFTDRIRLIGMLYDIGEHYESIKETQNLLSNIEKNNIWKDNTFVSITPESLVTVCDYYYAKNYSALGNAEMVRRYIEKLLEKISNIKSEDANKADILTFTVEALERLGDFSKVKPLIEQAYAISLNDKVGILQPHILSQYAYSLSLSGHLLKAMELFDQCISFNEDNEYMGCVPYYKILMARTYAKAGLHRAAVDILYSAEEISKSQKNENHLALTYYELFELAKNRPDLEKEALRKSTKEYLQSAHDIARKLRLDGLLEKCKKAYKDMH